MLNSEFIKIFSIYTSTLENMRCEHTMLKKFVYAEGPKVCDIRLWLVEVSRSAESIKVMCQILVKMLEPIELKSLEAHDA